MSTCQCVLVGCGVGDKVGLAVGLGEGSEEGAVMGEATVQFNVTNDRCEYLCYIRSAFLTELHFISYN